MKPGMARAIDLRGFGWPLVPLERLRALQAERARGDFAVLLKEQRIRDGELARMRSVRERDLRERVDGRQVHVDLALSRHAVQHFARSLGRIARAESEATALHEHVAIARAACLDAQRKVDAARKLRESALRVYAREQVRREAREADLAWLVRHGRGQVEVRS